MVKNRIIRKCVWIISARIFVSLEFLEFSELEKKIQATVLAMEKANVAKVTVDRYVHPGTCISVNGMKTQVQELEQHVEYARRGNGIIVYHIDEA